jgi:tetratricopeptide (TPR) repeat protein
MKAYVFTDKALTSRAGQFVWLAIDTEKALNAPVLLKYPVGAWPSFYIVDPRNETMLVRWTGGGTVEQMATLLDAGRAAWKPPNTAGGTAARDPRAAALASADKLNGEAKYAEAATAYGALLAQAPQEWKDFARVVDAYLFSLTKADKGRECAEASLRYYPRVAGTSSAMSVSAMGIDCAVELEKDIPERAQLVAEAEKNGRAALADPRVKVAVDDRSGLYISLISAREDAGDADGKKALAADWVKLLEEAAAKAPNPDARAVFDAHRLSAYLEIAEPQRAVPMLEASERDLPKDYNPPARLAVAYKEMKDYGKALAASDRALAKVYGPRRLQVWRVRADIYEAQGDSAAAQKALRQAIGEAEALPQGQRPDRTIAAFKQRLEKLAAPPADS